MPDKKKKTPEDYAGGGSDFPQEAKDAASPQKGMFDDDMGKYGGVQSKKTPKTVTRTLNMSPEAEAPEVFTGRSNPLKPLIQSHGHPRDEAAENSAPLPEIAITVVLPITTFSSLSSSPAKASTSFRVFGSGVTLAVSMKLKFGSHFIVRLPFFSYVAGLNDYLCSADDREEPRSHGSD